MLFSPSRMQEIKNVISTRRDKALTTLMCTITPDEFISTFIKPEHIELLKSTREIVGDIGATWYVSSKIHRGEVTCSIQIEFMGGKSPIIVPKYVEQSAQPSAPVDVIERISKYLDMRINIGSMFGDVLDTIYWANSAVSDIRGLRALLPCLPTLLMDINSDPKSSSHKIATKLIADNRVSSLPTLPREVKLRMLEASNLVTATTLLDEISVKLDTTGLAKITANVTEIKRNHLISKSMNGAML